MSSYESDFVITVIFSSLHVQCIFSKYTDFAFKILLFCSLWSVSFLVSVEITDITVFISGLITLFKNFTKILMKQL